MDITALNETFSIPGALAFEQHGELTRAVITTPAASATVYLQGAHLAEWQPAAEAPVLFMSAASAFKRGKAIRGGVPVIFPWFGDRHDGQPGPAHGFARTEEWSFAFAALVGDELRMTLTLAASEASRALGFDAFHAAYELTIGRRLTMALTVANAATTPLVYEEALHSYFAVGDIRKSSVTGLHNVAYLDKRDGGARKIQTDDPLIVTRDTDRVYLGTTSTCVIDDQANNRRITVAKQNSATTIVWNPWAELTAKMADMAPDGWEGMICIESANAGDDAIKLGPGETHTLRSMVSVEKAVV
jgi:glucose-6-phosphate 1-epimerase